MSARSALRQLRDRPISEHERNGALLVTAVVIAATLLLALALPSASPPRARSAPSQRIHGHEAQRPPDDSPASIDEATAAARRFLHGYLAYVYGRSRAAELRGATSGFVRSLPVRAPRVPPSMRARHPRVVALHAMKASAGAIEVVAVINDDGLVDYPIALLLSRRDSGMLVTGLGGA